MDLILTDSKWRASQFAHALGAKPRRRYYEGQHVIVGSWSGRPFHLAAPEDYDPRFARWSLDDLPIVPTHYRLIPTAQAAFELELLKGLFDRREVTRLIIASEPSEEADEQARAVLAHIGGAGAKKTERFVSSLPLSREAIAAGLNSLVPLDEWDRACEIGATRDQVGWLVGHTLSRLVSLRTGDRFSFGRITTPVMRLIAGSQSGGERRAAAGLPNLTDLQVRAGRAYRFSARKTLAIAERLYEGYKAITYPATAAHRLEPREAGLIRNAVADLAPLDRRIPRDVRAFLIESLSQCDAGSPAGVGAILPLRALPRSSTPDEDAVYRLVIEGFERALGSPRADGVPTEAAGHDATSEADILESLERFGVGTVIERTFAVDRLVQRGACMRLAQRIEATDYGKRTVAAVERVGSLHWFTDLQSIGSWERLLSGDPAAAYAEIVTRLQEACALTRRSTAPTGRKTLVYTCPFCGGHLREGKRFYYCRNARTACRFFLPKEKAGHALSDEDLRALTRPGRSFAPSARFRTAGGRTVRGRLYYDYTARRVRIDYLGPRYSHIPHALPPRRAKRGRGEP